MVCLQAECKGNVFKTIESKNKLNVLGEISHSTSLSYFFVRAFWDARVTFYHQVDLYQTEECWRCHWLLGIFCAWLEFAICGSGVVWHICA